MTNKLQFSPWISEAYKSRSGKYGNLLLIGESHYINKDESKENDDLNLATSEIKKMPDSNSNFTSQMVIGFIEKRWDINFYRNLGLLFNENDKYELWKHVSFANAIQVGLEYSDCQPSKEEIETVKQSFWTILSELKPDKIIVCSKRMWEKWMPDDDERGKGFSDISLNGLHSTVWRYEVDHHISYAIGINHPSRFFSYKEWRPFVFKFLNDYC